MITAIPHVHKYIRTPLNKRKKTDGAQVFKCVMPGCPHFVAESLVEGRVNICWVCDSEFAMTKKAMKLKKPHCDKCYSRTDLRMKNKIPAAKLSENTKEDWGTILSRIGDDKDENNRRTS